MTDCIYLDVYSWKSFWTYLTNYSGNQKSIEAKEKEELQQLYQEQYRDYKTFFEKQSILIWFGSKLLSSWSNFHSLCRFSSVDN